MENTDFQMVVPQINKTEIGQNTRRDEEEASDMAVSKVM
jgi:hypothetical protein